MDILNEINKDNYFQILKEIPYDDENVINYLKENEEKVLNKIFEFSDNISLDEKRIKFIRSMLDYNAHLSGVSNDAYEKIYTEINRLRESKDASILELQQNDGGATHRIFTFRDKIIKFGKYFKIPDKPEILQPEFSLMLGNEYNTRMTIFEKIKVLEPSQYQATQIMYNKIRKRGLIWLDPKRDNVGIIEKREFPSDDGLRIIDAECMEDFYSKCEEIENSENEYNNYGSLSREDAIKNFFIKNDVWSYEETYRDGLLHNNLVTIYDIKKVAETVTLSRFQRIKKYFANLFSKDNKEIDDQSK